MKYFLYFLAFIVCFLGIILSAIFCPIAFAIEVILIFVAVILIGIHAAKRPWKCKICKTEKHLTIKENLFGINEGNFQKSLYCQTCQKKTSHIIMKQKKKENRT